MILAPYHEQKVTPIPPKAAAVLRRARSMYLHCTALPSESQMPKSIQSKPREMANEHSRQQAHQCGAK